MAHPGQPQLTIYPVSSYTFGTKPPKFEKDTSTTQRMERLKEKYQREGVRRSVDGVLIVHEHNHPHVLLVQVGSSFFKLPGGRLRPGEDEVEGLMRKLNNLLAPAAANFRPNWRVGECLATYYRPNFENAVYPYCPAHVTRPKEIKRVWHVVLPDRSFFSIPKNMRLVAVPLFEIYDNAQRYGPIIASIPQLLSRYQLMLAGAGGLAKAPSMPGPAAPSEHFMQQGQQPPLQPQQPQQQMGYAQQAQHGHAGTNASFSQPMQQQGGQQQVESMQQAQHYGAQQQQQQQQYYGGQQQQPAGDDFMVEFDDE